MKVSSLTGGLLLLMACAREVPPDSRATRPPVVAPPPQGDELCQVIGEPLVTPRVQGLMQHLQLENKRIVFANAAETAMLRGGLQDQVYSLRLLNGSAPLTLPGGLKFGMNRAQVKALHGEPVKVLFSGEDVLYLCSPKVGLQLSFDRPSRGISDSLYGVILVQLDQPMIGQRTVLPVEPEPEKPLQQIDQQLAGTNVSADVRYAKTPMRYQLSTRDHLKFNGTLTLNGLVHMQGDFVRSRFYPFAPDPQGFTTLFDKDDPAISLKAHFNGYYALAPGDGEFTFKGKTYRVKVFNETSVWSRAGLDALDNQLLIDHLKYRSLDASAGEAPLPVEAFGYEVWYRTVVRNEKLQSDVVKRMVKKNDHLNGLLDATADAMEKAVQPSAALQTVEREASGIEGMAPYTKVIVASRDRPLNYLVIFLIPKEFEVNTKVTTTASVLGGGRQEVVKLPVERQDLGNGVVALRQVMAIPKDDHGLAFTITVTRSANGESVPLRMILKQQR